MRHRAVLVVCGVLLAAAWGLTVLVFASPEFDVRIGFFAVFLCLAAALTWWAIELLRREWRGKIGRFRAAPISGIAAFATLWLAGTEAALPFWARAVGGILIFVVPFLGLVLAARALVRRRRKNAPQPHLPSTRARDERLAEKAFEARAAQKGSRF